MLVNNNTFAVYDLLPLEYLIISNFTFESNHFSLSIGFAFLLYVAGLLGMVFNYRNFLITMMTIELMYLGAVSSFVLYGTLCHDPRSSTYGLLLLILAACESAIGLGILIVLYRFGQTVDFKAFQTLGG
jgi:NADH-quinone oxidoreductase subunit K